MCEGVGVVFRSDGQRHFVSSHVIYGTPSMHSTAIVGALNLCPNTNKDCSPYIGLVTTKSNDSFDLRRFCTNGCLKYDSDFENESLRIFLLANPLPVYASMNSSYFDKPAVRQIIRNMSLSAWNNYIYFNGLPFLYRPQSLKFTIWFH